MKRKDIVAACAALLVLWGAIIAGAFLWLRSISTPKPPMGAALTVIRGMEKRQASIHRLWGEFHLKHVFNMDPRLRARSSLPDWMQPNSCIEELAFDGRRFRDSIEYEKPLFATNTAGAVLDWGTKKDVRWSDGVTAMAVGTSVRADGSTRTSAAAYDIVELRRTAASTTGIGFHPNDLNRAASYTFLDLEGKFLPGLDALTYPKLLRAGEPRVAGTEVVNGVRCHVLAFKGTQREPYRIWVAPSLGFATVRTEQVRMQNEGNVRRAIAIAEMRDFANYGGLWFPSRAEWKTQVTFKDGATFWDDRWALTVKEVHVNEPVPAKKLSLDLPRGTAVWHYPQGRQYVVP